MVEQLPYKKYDFTKSEISNTYLYRDMFFLMSLLSMYLNYKNPQIFHDYVEVVTIEPLVEEINVRA